MWNLILVTVLLVSVMHRVTSEQEGCGQTLFSWHEGKIVSPDSSPHNNTISCTYFINAAPHDVLHLALLDFDLDDNCTHDWLMITCNETNDENLDFRRRLCGADLPRTSLLFTSCPVVELRYHSDSPGKNRGFMIRYKTGCGQTLFSRRENYIMSPNIHHYYSPHNNTISCTYFINVGPQKFLHLKFYHFDLDDSCTHDWLMITCNETNDENLDFRRRLCGTNLPRPWLSFTSCPVVELRYHSDSAFMKLGFSIWYTIVENTHVVPALPCGDTMFTSSFGVINLPTNLDDEFVIVNCTFTISTYNTSTISVSLDASPLELRKVLESFVDCNTDFIMIGCVSDGDTELNPNTSIKYCLRSNNLQPKDNVFSNCRMVEISMRSSHYTRGSAYHFLFAVHSSDAQCSNTSFISSTGTILSPGFPLSYPPNLDCVYTIDVDRTKTISFDFLQFNLEGISKFPKKDVCLNDWLKVSCLSDGFLRGSPSLENKYCGKMTTPITLSYSNCDFLTLNFVTDSSVSRDGFQLRYTIENGTSSETDEGCGNKSFGGITGFINSPRFPLSYPNNLECVYSIDVDKKKRVLLHFLTFSLEGTQHATFLDQCIYDWLLISCISDGEETHPHRTRRRKYCGERTSSLVLSYSNCDSLTLSFVTDSSHTSGGFQLKYTLQNESVVTFEYGTNGIIASPWYPFPFPDDVSGKFSVLIDVGRKNSILLRFIYFEMEMPDSEGHCRDWLSFTCNEPTTGNPNNGKKYCGTIRWTSSLLFVDCNSLELEFFANEPSGSNGFLIEYTATENSTNDNSELDCGTTLFTNTSGVISLPRNTRDYLSTVNCTYTVSANHLSNIWLDIHITQEFLQLLESFQDCDREYLTIGCVSEEEMEEPYNTTVVLCRYGRSMSDISEHRLLIADCRKLQVSIRSTNYDNPETFLIPFRTVGPSDSSVNTQTSVSGQRGHAVGISLVVIVVVTGAICLGAFLLFRRHLKKKRPQLLMQESAEETRPLELEDDIDTTKPGHRKEDRDTSKYVPLRSMSISDHDTSPPGNNFKQIHSEIQPGF